MSSQLVAEDLRAALGRLGAAASALAPLLEHLSSGMELGRASLDRVIETMIAEGRQVRDLIYTTCERLQIERPSWSTQLELQRVVDDLVATLDDAMLRQGWERLKLVLDELRAARITHRQAARASRLDALRTRAIAEIESVVANGETRPIELPWPGQFETSWVHWVLALEEPEAGDTHLRIAAEFPDLEDLLTTLESDSWMFAATELRSTTPGAAATDPVHEIAEVMEPGPPSDPSPHDGPDRENAAGVSVLDGDSDTPLVSIEMGSPIGEPPAVEASYAALAGTAAPVPQPLPAARDAVTRMEEAAETPDEVLFSTESIDAPPPSSDQGPDAPLAMIDAESTGPIVTQPRRTSTPHDLYRQVSAPIALPADLASFDAYSHVHWRNAEGVSEPAPWRDEPCFSQRLETAAEQAFTTGNWAHLLVFTRAAKELKLESLPWPRDVEALVNLVSNPSVEGRGADASRVDALLAFPEDVAPSFRLRLLLLLEALAPGVASLPAANVRSLCKGAGYDSSSLSSLLEAAFQVNAEGGKPALQVLRAANQVVETPEDPARQLEAARTLLRSNVDDVWQTPRNIKTRHCRAVWQEFMVIAQPVLHALTRSPERAIEVHHIDRLAAQYDAMADRGDAAHDDRKRMNRVAGKLFDQARDVVRLTQRVRSHQRRPPVTKAMEELESLHRAIPARDNRSAASTAYLGLLEQIVRGVPSTVSATIRVQDFLDRPGLLETTTTVSGDSSVAVEIGDIARPVHAAAMLLTPAIPGGAQEISPTVPGGAQELTPTQRLIQRLTQRLRQLERDDLLVHVQPVSVRDSQHASAALTSAQVELERELAETRRVVDQLSLCASAVAGPLGRVIEEARRLSNERTPYELKPQILVDWITRARQEGQRALSQVLDSLQQQARQYDPDRAATMIAALQQHRLADALAIAAGEPLPLPANTHRAIISRSDAKTRWWVVSNPASSISAVRGDMASRLVHLWFRQGLRGNPSDQKLSATFAQFVFEPIARKDGIQPRKRGNLDALIVGCGVLREWLANTDHNPSFLPQLTAFKTIGIVTPPTVPTDEAFVRKTADYLARGTDSQILVVLTPRITASVRDTFRQELQRRNWRGVTIVDDIDLLRLLNPGGQLPDLPLGLLELVLEQQPKWMPVNPFELLEGQHTKPEMYVGRRDEAERLAKTANYSRVFSGRRLGKSALLKHIGDTYHGRRSLPSHNVLRVLYVPIVGIQDDEQVVERICHAFHDRLSHSPTLSSPRADERLKELIETWLAKNRTASVLIVLDEADMFVAAQIRRYKQEHETCLTWKMRTDLEAAKDRNDLPRVRFVFAGYRATHLSEGAWANWGDVLRLQPLTPAEAAELIAGPLARLGIDASVEANTIAFQCGYQPAVIVRFGQQLLQHLDATLTPAQRERPVITPEHVAHVFQSSAVQEEIRKIVWNNFPGNLFGKVVFAALLLEFGGLPPGAALDDAPQQVLSRLRNIEPQFLTTDTARGAPFDRIARELREFVDRSLIVAVSATDQSYQLRFPHHLPVLLQQDQDLIIRQEIAALGGESDSVDVVQSMLTNTALDEMAAALGGVGAELGIRVVVAASHWMAALESSAAKLTTRLGLLNHEVLTSGLVPRDLMKVHRAIPNVSPVIADSVVKTALASQGQPTRLLLGGVDLLRWALHRDRADVVEVATVVRLGLAQLRWWFERVREINFSGSNPGARFLELTGGIPFLVGLLDRAFEQTVGFDGATASEDDVNAAFRLFAERLPVHISELCTGDASVKLERREIELLILYAYAARQFQGDYVEVMHAWEDWKSEGFPKELTTVAPLGPGDLQHVDVLLRLGLIPVSAAPSARPFDRIGTLRPNDPLSAVADQLLRCLST